MKSRLIFVAVITLFVVSLEGCATGNCRQVESLKRSKTAAAAAPAAAPDKNGEAQLNDKKTAQAGSQKSPVRPEKTVVIYKYDGSRQCGMGQAVSAEDMEKELKGIQVLSRGKKSDGLMHIQVCGQPTGMVNYYEIPETNLAEAQKRGFRKWDLD